jgi:hypothetical protein
VSPFHLSAWGWAMTAPHGNPVNALRRRHKNRPWSVVGCFVASAPSFVYTEERYAPCGTPQPPNKAARDPERIARIEELPKLILLVDKLRRRFTFFWYRDEWHFALWYEYQQEAQRDRASGKAGSGW